MILTGSLYEPLYARFGPQGWWPLPSHAGEEGFDGRGYSPARYASRLPKIDQWQVACGAILTQNTNWKNAERALHNLLSEEIRSPDAMLAIDRAELERLIRPSGYYRQKAERLRSVATFFRDRIPDGTIPARDLLLALPGVGPETADSILLYAFQHPIFVVDAYTIRLFDRVGIIRSDTVPRNPSKRYHLVQNIIQTQLVNANESYSLSTAAYYQEFHALIVAACATHCRARPLCEGCPLEFSCASCYY